MLEYFARSAPPEEQELAALVQKRGGAEVVVRDDAALAELLFYNVGPDSDAEKGAARADDAAGAAWPSASWQRASRMSVLADGAAACRLAACWQSASAGRKRLKPM